MSAHGAVHPFIFSPLDLCPALYTRVPQAAPLSNGQTSSQIIATSRKLDHRPARPLHTSTVEHVLTSGSDIFWSWSSSRRLSGSDSFTAAGTCGNIQTRGGAKTHNSMITMVTLSYVKLQVHCEGVSDVSRCRTCERSPLVHVYDSWTCPARYLETSSSEVTYYKQLNPEDTRTFKLFLVMNSVK